VSYVHCRCRYRRGEVCDRIQTQIWERERFFFWFNIELRLDRKIEVREQAILKMRRAVLSFVEASIRIVRISTLNSCCSMNLLHNFILVQKRALNHWLHDNHYHTTLILYSLLRHCCFVADFIFILPSENITRHFHWWFLFSPPLNCSLKWIALYVLICNEIKQKWFSDNKIKVLYFSCSK
jgi:hypothetical protein